jgi:hypothetical protein
MPQRAAGARVEPPVSLPMAISHMRSATATAAPEEEPPGTRVRFGRVAGRPVMRILAQNGESEFDHVGLGNDHAPGGAQPPYHRRAASAGAYPGLGCAPEAGAEPPERRSSIYA